jgi:hypothetical protein
MRVPPQLHREVSRPTLRWGPHGNFRHLGGSRKDVCSVTYVFTVIRSSSPIMSLFSSQASHAILTDRERPTWARESNGKRGPSPGSQPEVFETHPIERRRPRLVAKRIPMMKRRT